MKRCILYTLVCLCLVSMVFAHTRVDGSSTHDETGKDTSFLGTIVSLMPHAEGFQGHLGKQVLSAVIWIGLFYGVYRLGLWAFD